MAEEQTRAEVNRLYWGSDASVAEIADRLGISRRGLYDSIDPQPAGASCPACGGELAFRNRTAADRREGWCPTCEREEVLPPVGSDAGEVEEPAEDPEAERLARGARLSPMPPRRVPVAASGPALGGALLAGLAAGAVVAYLVRRG